MEHRHLSGDAVGGCTVVLLGDLRCEDEGVEPTHNQDPERTQYSHTDPLTPMDTLLELIVFWTRRA